jgi:hypothetical protein
MKRIIISGLFLALAWLLNGQPGEPKNLSVIVHPGDKIPSNTSIIYTPCIRAAWTLLKEDIVGEDIVLERSLPVTAALTKHPFRVTHDDDWLAMAGFIENGIIDQINKVMMTFYGIKSTGLDEYADDEGIVCYSYISESIRFSEEFETLRWDFSGSDGSHNVECFGVAKGSEKEKEAMRKQVVIHDYRHSDDFIVRIIPGDERKEIILAKVPQGRTLSDMVTDIDRRITLPGESKLTSNDELVIPKIKFETKQSYDDISGLHLKNKGFTDYFFVLMAQGIRFSLDESGIEAQATGELVLKKGPAGRNYIFDKPFMVLTRYRDAAEPDFIIWIDNAELLKPVN